MNRMLLTLVLLTAALAPAALAQDNEAEKLFRAIEKKIKAAKAIEVAFTYQLEEGKTARGALLLTNDNKTRLKVSGHYTFRVEGNPSFELISDGKRFKTVGAKLGIASNGQPFIEPGGTTHEDTGKGFGATIATTLNRGGIGYSVLVLPYFVHADADIDPDMPDSKLTVHDFKAGAPEKVGERQAKVLRYRFGKGGNDDAQITLWIDAESGLPLKRVFAQPGSGSITEAYSEFRLNPEVDANAFVLPK